MFQNLKRPVLSRQNARVRAHTVTGQILEQECSRQKVPQPEKRSGIRVWRFETTGLPVLSPVERRTGTKAQLNRTLWNPHRRTFQIRTAGLYNENLLVWKRPRSSGTRDTDQATRLLMLTSPLTRVMSHTCCGGWSYISSEQRIVGGEMSVDTCVPNATLTLEERGSHSPLGRTEEAGSDKTGNECQLIET